MAAEVLNSTVVLRLSICAEPNICASISPPSQSPNPLAASITRQSKDDMNKRNDYIQDKWKKGLLPGIDCILFGNGEVITANTHCLTDTNTKKSKQFWFPLCDTTITSLEKYEDDIWTNIEIFHGAINYGEQKIVFGDGSMGNEGFVASTNKKGDLIWGIFFTFSNPIFNAKIINNELICVSELEIEIKIELNNLTKISIENKSMY